MVFWVEEILSLSGEKSSVTIYLKEDEEEYVENVQKIKYKLEYTCLKGICGQYQYVLTRKSYINDEDSRY